MLGVWRNRFASGDIRLQSVSEGCPMQYYSGESAQLIFAKSVLFLVRASELQPAPGPDRRNRVHFNAFCGELHGTLRYDHQHWFVHAFSADQQASGRNEAKGFPRIALGRSSHRLCDTLRVDGTSGLRAPISSAFVKPEQPLLCLLSAFQYFRVR